MSNIFSQVSKPKIKKTTFNLSHEKKLSMDMGKLTPVLVQEVVPGDKFQIRSDVMVKLAPMILPLMHRIDVYIHYFFVPNRILWSGWEGFITGDDDSVCPTFTAGADHFKANTLADFLGLPDCSGVTTEHWDINELPWRAYWKIWNDYYRDENLQEEADIENLSGSQLYGLAFRSWAKDYFTSALPWAQKGDPVRIPNEGATTWNVVDDETGVIDKLTNGLPVYTKGDNLLQEGSSENPESLFITETGFNINELRLAERLQRWLERNARAGSRYVEHLLAHWGIYSKDARLQRAEYIGGGATPVMISDVLQTSKTDGTAYLGEPAGHGIAVGNKFIASKFCDEHGFIMGIASIVPKPAYYQGLHKMLTRSLVTDFYFPEFANLGEQEIKNQELYFDPTDVVGQTNEAAFGYQSRYAEYKYSQDQVHGDYRDNLEAFHLGRKFAATPSLNSTFISMSAEAPDLEARIFAAGRDTHPFWVQIYHNIIATRPMPYYGTPEW